MPPRRSVLILGPRQTGKSTFVRTNLPQQSWTIDLLQHDDYLKYSKEPSAFAREVQERARRGTRVVFVDEVQKVPALMDEVHRLIESLPVRFVLTGSSARKLRRGGTNLLAGRAETLAMHPLTAQEQDSAFNLDRTLRLGSLPAVVTGSDEAAKALLRSYAETYLREEIQAESIVRNLGGFARFLDVAAAQSGELLNGASVARDAGVAARTVQEYFQILEDTLLGFRLEAWRKSVRSRLVAHSKFYLFDTGVTNALAHRLTATVDSALRGRLFGQCLFLECHRYIDYAKSETRLYFWRTNHGAEVDLVIERHGKLLAAVETKTGKRVGGNDLSGLRAFAAENAGVPRFIVTPNAEPQRIDDVLVTNWQDFIKQFRQWV
ncbi:MAG: ATP-binding protein [Phycisphaerae bacterium]|nr:ATP-binding protein [Phycisphaerae bacterium]